MSADDYTIREARPDEHSELLTFLLQHFDPYVEPAARYFRKYEHRIDKTEKKIMTKNLKEGYANMLTKYHSCVAVHNESNCIVGMCLMSVKLNPKFQKTEEREGCINLTTPIRVQTKIQTDFFNYVLHPLIQSVDFFAEFPKLQAALDLMVLCVDSKYAGQGIATRLVNEAMKYAKNKNIGCVYGLFTSPSSRKAAEKNGFQTYSNIDLLSLRDGDGNIIFKDTESYEVSLMAKCFQSSS